MKGALIFKSKDLCPSSKFIFTNHVALGKSLSLSKSQLFNLLK